MNCISAVYELETWALQYLDSCVPDFNSTHIQPVADYMQVDKDIARVTLKRLRNEGLATYERGLWYDDGTPAGAGYSITPKGREVIRARLESSQ